MADSQPSTASGDRAPEDLEALRGWIREGVVHANDGIVATAGIIEGFAGAGFGGSTIVVAAFTAMLAGGVAVGGAQYTENAAERDARAALLEEERVRLELTPDEELAELVDIYRAKGLSADLAHAVATELTEQDALAAHADAEYGLPLRASRGFALLGAVIAGLAFAGGAAVPLLTVLIAPDSWRVPVTFVAVIVSLSVTSLIVAVTGRMRVLRTIVRTVAIGTVAMLVTLLAGHLFHP